MPKAIKLDGTTLEGGGQLLRIALGISALTDIPIHVYDIRGKRSGGGGLKNQHLTCVKWLASASAADTEGAELRSTWLKFNPNLLYAQQQRGKKKSKSQSTLTLVEQKSPGSVGLVIQAILPFLFLSGAFNSSETLTIDITGGTNVTQSPSFDYLTHVLLPTLRLAGLPAMSLRLKSRGWSTGGTKLGALQLDVQPMPSGNSLPAFHFRERGEIQQVEAFVIAPADTKDQLKAKLDQQIKVNIVDRFPQSVESSISWTIHFEDSRHPKRWYLLLVATSTNGFKLGRDLLYDRKIRSQGEAVADLVDRVVHQLAEEISHGGCVDEHMRDQLVVFQGLAKGRSRIEYGHNDEGPVKPSLHTETARWVVSRILGIQFDPDGTCEGVGFVPGEDYAKRGGTPQQRDDLALEVDSLRLN